MEGGLIISENNTLFPQSEREIFDFKLFVYMVFLFIYFEIPFF